MSLTFAYSPCTLALVWVRWRCRSSGYVVADTWRLPLWLAIFSAMQGDSESMKKASILLLATLLLVGCRQDRAIMPQGSWVIVDRAGNLTSATSLVMLKAAEQPLEVPRYRQTPPVTFIPELIIGEPGTAVRLRMGTELIAPPLRSHQPIQLPVSLDGGPARLVEFTTDSFGDIKTSREVAERMRKASRAVFTVTLYTEPAQTADITFDLAGLDTTLRAFDAEACNRKQDDWLTRGARWLGLASTPVDEACME